MEASRTWDVLYFVAEMEMWVIPGGLAYQAGRAFR